MAAPKANCLDCGKLGPIDEFCSCAGGARRAAWANSVYAKPAVCKCDSPLVGHSLRGEPFCARCSDFDTHVAPKPATTEPLEWKGIKFNPLSPEVLEMYRDMSKGCARITGVDFANGGGCTVEAIALSDGSILIDKITVHPAPPEPSPLDSALEDFIERRKAKREALYVIEDCEPMRGITWVEQLTQRELHEIALSRALSTPLPHDPDIHTRLMPWKGKADE